LINKDSSFGDSNDDECSDEEDMRNYNAKKKHAKKNKKTEE
jgi:hypothetical protein